MLVTDHAKGLRDSLFAPCSSAFYVAAGVINHRHCRDNLTHFMVSHGLVYLDLLDPINLFQYPEFGLTEQFIIHQR